LEVARRKLGKSTGIIGINATSNIAVSARGRDGESIATNPDRTSTGTGRACSYSKPPIVSDASRAGTPRSPRDKSRSGETTQTVSVLSEPIKAN